MGTTTKIKTIIGISIEPKFRAEIVIREKKMITMIHRGTEKLIQGIQ